MAPFKPHEPPPAHRPADATSAAVYRAHVPHPFTPEAWIMARVEVFDRPAQDHYIEVEAIIDTPGKKWRYLSRTWTELSAAELAITDLPTYADTVAKITAANIRYCVEQIKPQETPQ